MRTELLPGRRSIRLIGEKAIRVAGARWAIEEGEDRGHARPLPSPSLLRLVPPYHRGDARPHAYLAVTVSIRLPEEIPQRASSRSPSGPASGLPSPGTSDHAWHGRGIRIGQVDLATPPQ
jgi:hypothetical protein